MLTTRSFLPAFRKLVDLVFVSHLQTTHLNYKHQPVIFISKIITVYWENHKNSEIQCVNKMQKSLILQHMVHMYHCALKA
jgi:hypothetical protein